MEIAQARQCVVLYKNVQQGAELWVYTLTLRGNPHFRGLLFLSFCTVVEAVENGVIEVFQP